MLQYYNDTLTLKKARGTRNEADSLMYHIECADIHLEHARALCKDMRITTKVMYPLRPSSWHPRGIWHYMRQCKFMATHVIEYMEREGKIHE